MLVLTRKVGETIVIAGNIMVSIVTIEGGKVRLGIDALPTSGCSARNLSSERSRRAALRVR